LIGLVIVTHGRLGADLVPAMEHIVGRQSAVKTIAIGPDDDMGQRRDDIRSAINLCDSGDGVVIVTDLFGGTPSNLAVSLLERDRVEVVAGVNLPMLIAFNNSRQGRSVSKCAAEMTRAGKLYISNAREVVGRSTEDSSDAADEMDEELLRGPADSAEIIERQQAATVLVNSASTLSKLEYHALPYVGWSHGGMGHNRPPKADANLDLAIIEEASIAADVAAQELASAAPRRSVIQLCVGALKRVLKLLGKILKYLGQKGDKLLDATLESAGKAAGPTILASVLITQLKGEITVGLEALLKLLHLS
jgi:PTS system mannose-specific IIA component